MEQLSLTILGREYRVACQPEEQAVLRACAAQVDQKMTAIRDTGKVMGADRIAVMAALQIAHENYSAKNADGLEVGELGRRLRALIHACDEALLPQEKLF
jgi:cell division protein ZapA